MQMCVATRSIAEFISFLSALPQCPWGDADGKRERGRERERGRGRERGREEGKRERRGGRMGFGICITSLEREKEREMQGERER